MLGGIRRRLLGLVIATVVPFIALIGAGMWTQWRIDQARAIRSALVEARLIAVQVDDEIGNLESFLAGLSRAVSTNPADRDANDVLLRAVKADLPSYISNILLTGLDGNNIGTSGTRGRSYLGDRDFFREIVRDGKRFALGEPVRGRATGNWVTTVARAVERDGRLVALISIGMQLGRFQEGLNLRDLPPGTLVQVVNENGTIVARNVDGPSWGNRNVSDNAFVARHLGAKESSEAVLWPDSIERITGSVISNRVPWLVSVGLPPETAMANVVSRLAWSAAASAAALLIAFVLAWLFSARIIKPLRQLNEDASVLAAGDMSHRTAVSTNDEVGALANTFNTMASSLEGRHRELIVAREAAATEATKRALSEEMERQAKETLSAVIDAAPVAIVCSDTKRQVVLWSRAAEQIFGFSAETVLHQRSKIIPPEGAEESQRLFDRALRGETVRDVEVKRRRKDGTLVDIRLAATPMYNPDGSVWGVAWAYDDITDRKKAELQLNYLAHNDQLTGLPNRVALQNELAKAVSASAPEQRTAIALFDLDGFKDVNDTLGHSTGDKLLQQVGLRLKRVADRYGMVCRLGGDEFVIVVPNCGDPRTIAKVVDEMLNQLVEPFEINEHILHVAGSAGIAFAPNDGSTFDELIANADLALYKAKSEGGRTYRIFMPTLRAQAQMRRGLDLELRRAFIAKEFELYFQPQTRLADNAVVGAEALLRWRHPVQGLVGPAAFIDTLSDSPIAPAVGRWILREACEKAAAWRSAGISLSRISVNLFPCQSRDPALPADVEEVLARSGLPPEVLELELTETVALNHDDAILPLQKLHDKGIKLAFDDFGTGYASLSYLTRFPVSRIKIDRSFVSKITDNAQDAAIVRSLIAMAHNLGLGIIAEGVETTAQAAFLLEEQCEEAQGFLYSKPLPAAEFEAYLRTRQIGSLVAAFPDKRSYRGGNDPRQAGKPAGRRRLPRA